ncbi:MAG: GtrA family protein [Kofleriaceae bacterium]|nr:GtrA family protein [Kofleriaceae bacterium]
MKALSKQQLVAAAGGALSTGLDLGVLALVSRHNSIAVAAACGVAAGGALGYVWNKKVTFADRTPASAGQLLRFASVVAVTAVLMAVSMHIASVWMGVPYQLAKIACAALVFLVWTFPAQKLVVFSRQARRSVVPGLHASQSATALSRA